MTREFRYPSSVYISRHEGTPDGKEVYFEADDSGFGVGVSMTSTAGVGVAVTDLGVAPPVSAVGVAAIAEGVVVFASSLEGIRFIAVEIDNTSPPFPICSVMYFSISPRPPSRRQKEL